MDYRERELLLEEIEETLNQIMASQVPEENILEQWEIFGKGLPFVRLLRACTTGDGLQVIGHDEADRLLGLHAQASAVGRTMKFVPASGAATRMFKDLNAVLSEAQSVTFEELKERARTDKAAGSVVTFILHLEEFAFVDDLKAILEQHEMDLSHLVNNGEWRQILHWVLHSEGLNYSNLPKGLIPFHRYPEGSRTPIHEHLMEAAEYALTQNGVALIHFTLSEEHLHAVKSHLEEIISGVGQKRPRFRVTTSVQKRSTDTIAVTLANEPFRDARGKLIFRPGGHGALLENLNELHGDLIFIKNIDNVTADHLKAPTIFWKKLLCGLLIDVQDSVFEYLRKLESGPVSEGLIKEIKQFGQARLSLVASEDLEKGSVREQSEYLFSKLNRPLRVCGMVRNEGEPGGGPFWILDDKGRISLQIVESAQVDTKDADQKKILSSSTHFNPVDLVCGVRDFRGNNFDLREFSDKNMGFITIKSKDGRELKAMELPGLWNGAMALWHTIFVEVPSSTFNPVKTVIDLLRPQHQP